nr:hypothetical protein CFP56_00520 [Quercus suber]
MRGQYIASEAQKYPGALVIESVHETSAARLDGIVFYFSLHPVRQGSLAYSRQFWRGKLHVCSVLDYVVSTDAPRWSGQQVRSIYKFPAQTFIENIVVRPNGHLLLTTFREGSIYELDPDAADVEPRLIAQLPDVGVATGIVEVEEGVFAVTGARHSKPMRFALGSCKAFRIDLRARQAQIETLASIDDTEMLNGAAGITDAAHICLSLDSVAGRIFRIDTKTKKVDVILKHELLAPGERADRPPLGANGAKFRDGYLYFTNSSKEIFGRVKVDLGGNAIGEPETLVLNEDAPHPMSYDDFDFDSAGNAYIGTHPDKVYQIDPDGRQTLLASGGDIESPTSTAVSRDGKTLYVGCAGKLGEFHGRVVAIDLKASG